MSSIYRVFVEKLGGSDTDTFIGNYGEMWYDPDLGSLKVSDGVTPGGVAVGSGGGGTISQLTNGSATLVLETDGTLTLSGSNEITTTSSVLEMATPGGSWISIQSAEEEPTITYIKSADDSDDSAEWSFTSKGDMICPADSNIVAPVTGDAFFSVGVFDYTSSSTVAGYTYSQVNANNTGAYAQLIASNNLVNTAKVIASADPDNNQGIPLGIELEMYDGGGATSFRFLNGGRMNFPNLNSLYRPVSPVGTAGDKQGDVIFGDDGIYVCKQNYDGSTSIWGKAAYNFSW